MPKSKSNKLVLGITGGIGAGKSTVALMFKRRGCLFVDADKLGHRLLEQPEVKKKLAGLCGTQIIKHGRVDRAALGRWAFSSKAALEKLNRILRPRICNNIRRLIRGTDKRLVILDAPLILESGLCGLVDKLIVVTAKKDQRLLRSQKRLSLNKKEAARRMKSQISQKEKIRFADFIIDNSGQLNATKEQVSKIRRKLWKS